MKLLSVILLSFAATVLACQEAYLAVSGDTCQSIASKFNLDKKVLQQLNPSINCSNVKEGARVCIKNLSSSTANNAKRHYSQDATMGFPHHKKAVLKAYYHKTPKYHSTLLTMEHPEKRRYIVKSARRRPTVTLSHTRYRKNHT